MNRKKQNITKYNHKPRIISERAIPKKSIKSHYMVKFQYNSKNKYDNNPLVYVLPPRNEDRKLLQRSKTHIYGINLNYLTKQEVNYLLNETGVIKKSPNWVIFKRYDEYKDAFRTYSVDDMSNVKIIAEIGINHNGDIEIAKKNNRRVPQIWLRLCQVSKKKPRYLCSRSSKEQTEKDALGRDEVYRL